jgi:hypothetical protein
MQLLCGDVSESGGLGVCSAEDGSLWVWDPVDGEIRVRVPCITLCAHIYTCNIASCYMHVHVRVERVLVGVVPPEMESFHPVS